MRYTFTKHALERFRERLRPAKKKTLLSLLESGNIEGEIFNARNVFNKIYVLNLGSKYCGVVCNDSTGEIYTVLSEDMIGSTCLFNFTSDRYMRKIGWKKDTYGVERLGILFLDTDFYKMPKSSYSYICKYVQLKYPEFKKYKSNNPIFVECMPECMQVKKKGQLVDIINRLKAKHNKLVVVANRWGKGLEYINNSSVLKDLEIDFLENVFHTKMSK